MPESTVFQVHQRVAMTRADEQRISLLHPGHRLTRGKDVRLLSKPTNDFNADDEQSLPDRVYAAASLAVQPVVWASLYCVKTTGAGLPEGPFGLLGAVEGISYLMILAQAFGLGTKSAQQVSIATLGAGLLVLLTLVVNQGCIPMPSRYLITRLTYLSATLNSL